jgi:DNA-binding CsgD family transcriptional regulator/pimeloyl-ACP methyl ester carboxylesterase
MPGYFSHLEVYWTQSTYLLPWFQGLANRFRLVLYDGRGQGMSTRNHGEEWSIEDLGRDLEAIVSRLDLNNFMLMANGPSCHPAVRFAAAQHDHVSGLILVACGTEFASWPLSMYQRLPAENWDVFLRRQLGRGLNPEESVQALGRITQSITQQDYMAIMGALVTSNVKEYLSQLSVPTLVMHPRDCLDLPPEESMKVAAQIADARMVLIDGEGLPGESSSGLRAIDAFVANLAKPGSVSRDGTKHGLSSREVEVLRLLAAGRSNQQIADELVISLNTVIRHVSNIFSKIGAANRTEASVYARDNGIA